MTHKLNEFKNKNLCKNSQMFFFIDRHSNGSGENDDGDDQPDDAGSLSRSASESSVAQAQIENGLNINNNGYHLRFSNISFASHCH